MILGMSFILFSRFDLELHAVHRNSKGEIAVIGVWYKIGKPDPFLSKVWYITPGSSFMHDLYTLLIHVLIKLK